MKELSKINEKINNLLLYAGKSFLLKYVQLKPAWANIRVTENCNSRCITCYAWKNNSQNELTTEETKNALHQLWDIGVRNLIFIGGEPLLRSDLGDLIKDAYENLRPRIDSNIGISSLFWSILGLILSIGLGLF